MARLTAVVGLLMVVIQWIVWGPPKTSADAWLNQQVSRWWSTGLLLLALITSLPGLMLYKRQLRLPQQRRAARPARIKSQRQPVEQTMSKLSLEGLRKSGNPDFDVLEVFRLHKGSEVLARFKVQAHPADYAVVLVIGGEVDRIRHARDVSEMWAIAAAWKEELLAQGWRSTDPPSTTMWRSRHDGWEVTVAPRGDDGGYGCYFAFAKATQEPFRVVRPNTLLSPNLPIAQMEIIRVLAEKGGHVCSARCTPWTFQLHIEPDKDET